MYDRREKNALIFQDTEYMYTTNAELKNAVKKSLDNQYFIGANEELKINMERKREGKVVVSGKKSFEAASSYAKQGKKVCVHNFASATNPGGGVENGSSAQEESLCRCSTLYPCLNNEVMKQKFYMPHRRAHNVLYNDDCIYTPGVKVFKTDDNFPKLMEQKDWWDVDIITCAAPNLRKLPNNIMNPGNEKSMAGISQKELEALLKSRIERIFKLAIKENVEVLILGAFGCGAFRNPPELVAKVFAEFTSKYLNYFDVIEYAVFHTEREKNNYEAFVKAMK